MFNQRNCGNHFPETDTFTDTVLVEVRGKQCSEVVRIPVSGYKLIVFYLFCFKNFVYINLLSVDYGGFFSNLVIEIKFSNLISPKSYILIIKMEHICKCHNDIA